MHTTDCEYETDVNEECGAPAVSRITGTWTRPRSATSDLTSTTKVERFPVCMEHLQVLSKRLDPGYRVESIF